MKKVLFFVMLGTLMVYGEAGTPTSAIVETKQTELKQIQKEIEQLKRTQVVGIENKKYAIEEDIEYLLKEYYLDRSYKLKRYKIVCHNSIARIHYINVQVEVERELSFNDKQMNGTSVHLLQVMELDGTFSIVS